MPLNNDAFIHPMGKIDKEIGLSHHLTITGDIDVGIVKIHDTFQVPGVEKKVNISGSHYNDINGPYPIEKFEPLPPPPIFNNMFNEY